MSLALVVWIGGIIFFGAVVAPTVFSVLPTHDLAGNVVTRSLSMLHIIGTVCGVVYIAASLLDSFMLRGSLHAFAPRHLAIVAMIALTMASQYGVAALMKRLRQDIGVIDNISVDDPRRVEFNRLHHWSTRLEGCVLVLGLGVLYSTSRRLS
jgi:Domain of unknown function (DUF4149)